MSDIEETGETLPRRLQRLGVGRIKRHLIFCGGPKCYDSERGDQVWRFIKRKLEADEYSELGIYRTKVKCLRVCVEGPIALVYPEGVWYRLADESVCERIIEEHLRQGKIVEEHVLAREKEIFATL